MPDYQALVQGARQVLAGNRQQGTSAWGNRPYDFVCPSPDTYPFQWFWDSGFHAIALLQLDPELARQEIRCLLQAAQPDGFIPHMVLWDRANHEDTLASYSISLAGDHWTATIQPPVIARAVERIFKQTRDAAFVREVLPAVVGFFEWLARFRSPRGDALISIIQPDESGLDASPKFDLPMGMSGRASLVAPEWKAGMAHLLESYEPHRANPTALFEMASFRVQDIMINSIFGDGLRCLARLCRDASADDFDDAELDRHAAAVTNALMARCWDEGSGLFWDLAGAAEKPLQVLTVSSLFPLILEDLDSDVARRLVEEHLLNPAEFWTRYPLPSVATDEPAFDPAFRTQALWRGPTWVNANWYLYWGLRSHGYDDVATELAVRTCDMVTRGGMREFFNPFTAEGMGAEDFGWTALVLDLLAAEGLIG